MPDNIDNEQTFSGESLKGNSLDVKIGYDKRAAAKRDLAVVLQDVEGSQLTDEAGNELISEIEGFVTSELTSEKAVSVVAPTETRTVSNFYTVVFGNQFVVNKADVNREDHFNNTNGSNLPDSSGTNQVLWKKAAHVKIKNPDPTWKAIFKGARIQIASGAPVTENIDAFPEVTGNASPIQYPSGLPARTELLGNPAADGHKFETFIVDAVYEIPPTAGINVDPNTGYDYSRDNEGGTFEVQFNLSADPSVDSTTRLYTFLRRLVVKERSGTWKVEEVFASTSEVSSTLLGIDRAETQLSLFSNVSTYGFNSDEFVFYTDNPPTGPAEWSNRFTEDGVRRYPAQINEEKNEGALRVSTYPVPYHFPYPPLTVNLDDQGNDTLGLYNENMWNKWVSFLQLGKSLYEYFLIKRDNEPVSDNENSNFVKYSNLLTRFLPAINLWDDSTYYNSRNYNNDADRYYLQIDIWTKTYQKLVAGNELLNPVSGDFLTFSDMINLLPIVDIPVALDPTDTNNPVQVLEYDPDGTFNITGMPLRGTGKDIRMLDANGSSAPAGSVAVNPASNQDQNPYQETFINRTVNSASQDGSIPNIDDFVPGYGEVGGQFALLQSRQAFRYQPGRISGYTYGTRAFMDKTEGSNYGEWGIYNDFDEYVFRREGANFYIVRRSNIAYDVPMLQELGVADSDGNIDSSFVRTYPKTISGKQYTIQEVKLGKEKFNGDSLNGNGPSGYLLNTDEITMYKIEFGWYGAIGLRMYAYIPVEHGKARWVVVHTFVIENKLDVPSMGDPFFRFKYEVRIGAGQAPDLESPQLLYKYGTSMYIDGGDEGTVNVYSQTSDTKALSSTGAYTTLMGIYPKSDIVSGGGVKIPNKKIIIPKQISVTANGFAELNFTKCTACRGNGFVYMPNVTAGTNGITRKFNKLPTGSNSSSLTLSEINITTATVTADQAQSITVTADNIGYLRPGDYILEDLANQVSGARIVSITANGSNYDLAITGTQGDGAGNGIAQGVVITVQPTFISSVAGVTDHITYGLLRGDSYAKVIYPKIWNTYLGTNTTGSYNETIDLLMYVQSDRHKLDYERKLDPTKIVASQTQDGSGSFPPADFFGDTGTFDVRLSQRSAIVASPNPVSGPISFIKFLNPVVKESTGQHCNWRMGFTPNRPKLDNQGNLIGWDDVKKNFDVAVEEQDSLGNVRNVVALPESAYVALDYHQYNQQIGFTGLEQGEDWFGRIHPFVQDFRIGNPKGSYSGICSEIMLEKNDPTVKTVDEVAVSGNLDQINISSGAYPRWSSFNNTSDANAYLNLSDLWIQADTDNIYSGTQSPEGGQLAVRVGGVFNKVVYVDTDGNGTFDTECVIRFAGVQQSYQNSVNNEVVTFNVIPIKLYRTSDGTALTGASLASSALNSSGTLLVSSGTNFDIGYNSVTIKAWFQEPNSDGRYDSPNSYSGGALATGVFEFDAFPLYPFIEMYDNSAVNGAEIHDINLLGDISTANPQWKINQIDGNDTAVYDPSSNAQTGELNIDGVGNISQTPGIADDLVPPAFTQVDRLSSSQIDRQSESLLRPGQTTTTLYINDETKMFDLTDIFGFDRKVITPDIVNTEAVFITGRSLDNTNIDVTINITYVEQL